jgi:hypothetical protein
MKLFPHVGPKQLEQFLTYNLLPKVILAHEACEGEKLNKLMKIDLRRCKGYQRNNKYGKRGSPNAHGHPRRLQAEAPQAKTDQN